MDPFELQKSSAKATLRAGVGVMKVRVVSTIGLEARFQAREGHGKGLRQEPGPDQAA